MEEEEEEEGRMDGRPAAAGRMREVSDEWKTGLLSEWGLRNAPLPCRGRMEAAAICGRVGGTMVCPPGSQCMPPALHPPPPSSFTRSPSYIPDPLHVADALVDESYFTCVQLHSVALAFNEASARTAAVVRVGAVLRGVRVNLVGLLTLP